jgi:hypothetical protein
MENLQMRITHTWLPALGAAALLTAGCAASAGSANEQPTVSPKQMADALHAVMEADRTVYTRNVVNRLQNDEQVIKASEHWQDEKALPLPAQMFRMGSEMAAQKNKDFTYALLSMWPVNKQNAPKTDAERTGLQFVVDNPGQNFYTTETLAGKPYFTAVYPDTAVAKACITCHNEHKDSPRTDFKMSDVMGGVVVRIPIG